MTDGTDQPTTAAREDARTHDLRFARVGFAILAALSLGLAIAAPLTLDVGTFGASGPGMWPLGAAILACACSLVALLRPAILVDGTERVDRSTLHELGIALPALVVAVPALQLLGVGVTTLLIAAYWMRFVTHSSWVRTGIVAAAVTAGILLVFIVGLEVPFPRGSLTGI